MGVDPLELSCLRTCFNCVTTFLIMTLWYKHHPREFPSHLVKFMASRSFIGMIAFVSMTYGVGYLPISIFQIMTNTSPFFISIASYFILSEKLKKREFIGIIFAFIGVIIIVTNKAEGTSQRKAFDKYYLLGILLTLVYASFFGTVQVLTRRMREVHFTVIQFYYTLIASCCQFIFLMIRSHYNSGSLTKEIAFLNGVYSKHEWALLFVISIINVIWMSCFTIANQLESTVFLSIFSYISIVYALLSDFLIFEYKFKWEHGLGAIIILSVTFSLAYMRLKEHSGGNKNVKMNK